LTPTPPVLSIITKKQQIDTLATAILAGNRRALSQGITLIESTRKEHREKAEKLLKILSPSAGGSIRVGISGVPGAGKSTYIEALGLHLIKQEKTLAVLAVDPSSAVNGGSIMADKTRMEELSRSNNAFIRPSPSGCTLGGVTRRTRETLILCEAAGFDIIIVETVGVGQSETAVADITDVFLLLLLPGAGDELQGIKRGIVELADIILVNKADGDRIANANHAASDYLLALSLLKPRTKNWSIPVKTCSAIKNTGIKQSWALVEKYYLLLKQTGELSTRRSMQSKSYLWSEISDKLMEILRENEDLQLKIPDIEKAVVAGKISPTLAASEIINIFQKSL
jgi:LAO/AO transport system kinase